MESPSAMVQSFSNTPQPKPDSCKNTDFAFLLLFLSAIRYTLNAILLAFCLFTFDFLLV